MTAPGSTVTAAASPAPSAAAASAPLPLLQSWHAQGWIGPLDLALARFLVEQAPTAPASLVIAVAWLSRATAMGHACLDLARLADAPPGLLAWPENAREAWLQARALLPSDGAGAKAAWADAGDVLAVVDAASDPEGAAAERASSPWVLDGNRLYLRRFWRIERRVARQLEARAEAPGDASACAVDAAAARIATALDLLFDPPAPGETDLQREACRVAAGARLALITGGPGTGKTFTAARLLVLLHLLADPARPLRVALSAPTGKAAARLRQSLIAALETLGQRPGVPSEVIARAAATPAGTLHALLGVRGDGTGFVHGPRQPLPLDLLLLDEASMVDLALMGALTAALPAPARLVLLGDADQLASVEAGSVLGDLCRAPAGSAIAGQTVQLLRSRRFSGPIGELATAVRQGDADRVARILPAPADAGAGIAPDAELASLALPAALGEGTAFSQPCLDLAMATDARRPGHGGWLSRLSARPANPADFQAWVTEQLTGLEAFRVLCALREGPRGVTGLNEVIEREAASRGWIQRRGEWYEGRPVMVTRNDPGLGLFNGDIGLVLRAPSEPGEPAAGLRAWFGQGQDRRSVAVGRLPPVETAFAMTVHKSQGSEFQHVLLVLPDEDQPVLTRELLYTAITRARQALTVALHDRGVLRACLTRRTERMGGLADRLGGGAPDTVTPP